MAKRKTSQAQETQKIRALAGTVGDFIRYWGFRRIHGQIWATLYVSKSPLSGADLTRRLKVSKALVSPALSELEKHGLIRLAGGDGKTKMYEAHPKPTAVIAQVLKTREQVMIANASQALAEVTSIAGKSEDSTIDSSRLDSLVDMIHSASMAIALVISATEEGPDGWQAVSEAQH